MCPERRRLRRHRSVRSNNVPSGAALPERAGAAEGRRVIEVLEAAYRATRPPAAVDVAPVHEQAAELTIIAGLNEPVDAGPPDPPVQLSEHLWQVTGAGISHAWDAAAYLVLAGDPVLVDCGSPLGSAALGAHLRQLGVTPADITAVVATHGHFDHAGGAARLAAAGVPILLHAGDAAAVAAGDPLRTTAGFLYGQAFPPVATSPLADGDVVTTGSARLEIVHTPGHTPGSVCVVASIDGQRVLLAGDTLFGGYSADIGSDAAAWRASLDRLAGLDLDALSFGHGVRRLLEDPAGRIAEARLRFASYFDPWFKPPRHSFRY